MKMGGGKLASAGFTIAETMIVLAVTGLLFASTALLIVGRQNKAEFETSINNFQQQLQQVVNETASGYFPGMGSFGCTDDPATYNGVVTFVKPASAGGGAQGTNAGCLFLGKGVQFGIGALNSRFATYPFVGGQMVIDPATSQPVPAETVTQARPRVALVDENPTASITRPGCGDPIAPSCDVNHLTDGADDAAGALSGLTLSSTMQYGLQVAQSNAACQTPLPGQTVVPTRGAGFNPPARSGSAPPSTTIPPPVCFWDPNTYYNVNTHVAMYPGNQFVETGMAVFLFGGTTGALTSVDQGNVATSSQSLGLYAVGPSLDDGTTHSNSAGDGLGAVPGHLGNLPSYSSTFDTGTLRAATEVLVCLVSGTTNQSALITIGFGASTASLQAGGLGVTTKIMNSSDCS